jgi:hypothetical protein
MKARALLLAACVAGAMTAPATTGAARAPARVQVAAKEYRFALSRSVLRSGRVVIQLANFGEDPHDLVLQRLAPGARTFQTPVVSPGQQANLALRLGPARYRLWCSLADHRERGMRATLTLKR